MPRIKNKTTLNLILLFSIFAVSAAYFIQYILDHEPCNLCYIERIPYKLAVAIIIFNFFLKNLKELFLFCLV